MDLNEVKKQMEAFEEEAKAIRKEGEFEAIANELVAATREVENHKRRIEEYQYELDHLDTRYMDVVVSCSYRNHRLIYLDYLPSLSIFHQRL